MDGIDENPVQADTQERRGEMVGNCVKVFRQDWEANGARRLETDAQEPMSWVSHEAWVSGTIFLEPYGIKILQRCECLTDAIRIACMMLSILFHP